MARATANFILEPLSGVERGGAPPGPGRQRLALLTVGGRTRAMAWGPNASSGHLGTAAKPDGAENAGACKPSFPDRAVMAAGDASGPGGPHAVIAGAAACSCRRACGPPGRPPPRMLCVAQARASGCAYIAQIRINGYVFSPKERRPNVLWVKERESNC